MTMTVILGERLWPVAVAGVIKRNVYLPSSSVPFACESHTQRASPALATEGVSPHSGQQPPARLLTGRSVLL
jgi:hypothetical protein